MESNHSTHVVASMSAPLKEIPRSLVFEESRKPKMRHTKLTMVGCLPCPLEVIAEQIFRLCPIQKLRVCFFWSVRFVKEALGSNQSCLVSAFSGTVCGSMFYRSPLMHSVLDVNTSLLQLTELILLPDKNQESQVFCNRRCADEMVRGIPV